MPRNVNSGTFPACRALIDSCHHSGKRRLSATVFDLGRIFDVAVQYVSNTLGQLVKYDIAHWGISFTSLHT
jgi:hypothetical protein